MNYEIRKNDLRGLDPFFDSFFNTNNRNQLKTDIIENESNYELLIDLPSINKEDIKVTLNEGYLTVSVDYKKDESERKYLRRERNYYKAERSFYFDNRLTNSDVSCKLENGTLTILVNKVKENKEESVINID